MSNPVKTTPSTVKIGSLVIDGLMLADGSYRTSLTQAAKYTGLTVQNTLDFLRSKAIKFLLGGAYTSQIFEIDATDQALTGFYPGNDPRLQFMLCLESKCYERLIFL